MGVTDDLVTVRRIAVGGTAEIFLARQRDGTPVVVKRLLRDAPAGMRERLQREASILRDVGSSHVVALIAEDTDALVLELVDGIDAGALFARLAKRGEAVPLGATLAVGVGLGRALGALHARRVVHADVSPGNVLIRQDGTVKLADLGVARYLDEGAPSSPEGTLAYQPPEQLALSAVDPTADVYAAALIVYELATGTLARPAGQLGLAELRAARTQRPAPPSQVRPGLHPSFDDVVLAALDPNPRCRPRAREWLTALASLVVPPDPAALRALVRPASGAMIPPASTAAPPARQTAMLPARRDVDGASDEATRPTVVPSPEHDEALDPTAPTPLSVASSQDTAPGRTWTPEREAETLPGVGYEVDEVSTLHGPVVDGERTELVERCADADAGATAIGALVEPAPPSIVPLVTPREDSVAIRDDAAKTVPAGSGPSATAILGMVLAGMLLVGGAWVYRELRASRDHEVRDPPDREIRAMPTPEPVVVERAEAPPADAGEPPPPRHATVEETPPAARRSASRGPRVTVRGSGVMVRGPGMRGAAPRTSGVLQEGATLVHLEVRGLPVILRVVRTGEAIAVTVAAPPGTYYQVACNGRASRPTPLLREALDPQLACTITKPDGVEGAFVLRRR
ncbi:MAG: protein kinase [Deltaproteobacteria bacterium]